MTLRTAGFLLLLSAASCLANPFDARLTALLADETSHRSNPQQAVEQFLATAALAPDPTQLDDATVARLYQAAYQVAFYRADARVADQQHALHAELERRGQATAEQRRNLHGTLVQQRRFDAANALAAAHPDTSDQRLPPIVPEAGLDPTRPSLLLVDPDEPRLRRVQADLAGVTGVLVIASPGCHFSRDAVAAIEADPELARLFARHARWWQPPLTELHFDQQQRWNREHPFAGLSLVHASADWPQLDLSSMPQFYFLRDGQLVAHLSGWPKEGQREQLLREFGALGLLD